MDQSQHRFKHILIELGHHLPYTIFGVTAGIVAMGILTFIAQIAGAEDKLMPASEELFHVFHPAHLLFSAVATTAMFWKHDNRSWVKAVVVGVAGSAGICSISDIFMPYIGGTLLGYPMGFHVCIIDEPGLVWPFVLMGILAGLVIPRAFEKSTQYSHGVHVFLSSMASILYLLGYGLQGWMHAVSSVFLITVVSVMIPCCLSDIVFPMCCTHRYCHHTHNEEEGH